MTASARFGAWNVLENAACVATMMHGVPDAAMASTRRRSARRMPPVSSNTGISPLFSPSRSFPFNAGRSFPSNRLPCVPAEAFASSSADVTRVDAASPCSMETFRAAADSAAFSDARTVSKVPCTASSMSRLSTDLVGAVLLAASTCPLSSTGELCVVFAMDSPFFASLSPPSATSVPSLASMPDASVSPSSPGMPLRRMRRISATMRVMLS